MRQATCLALLYFLFACGVFAQALGRIAGSVIDPTGAAVAGVKVELYIAGGKTAVITVETGPTGEFSIASLRAAVYDISVEKAGFNRATVANVTVDPARETTIEPVMLELASATQTVEVKEAVQAVQSENAEVSTTVTQAQVENLPVLDRQVSNLFLTQAGVSEGKGAMTVNGLRTSLTNLSLDGVNIQDNFIRTNGLDFLPNKLTIGQVQELTVVTSNENPGMGLGATQVALTTPSGTNQLHGNVYWYNRNSALAANNFFNNMTGVDKPRLNLNQLGGSVGGAVIKDKLFFYLNYEAYRLKQQQLTTNQVLTPSARQGLLTYVDSSGAQRQFDVLKAQNLTIDPAMQQLLNAVPNTINTNSVGDGLNTGGYAFNARANEDRDNATGRVDYYLSQKHIFAGSYIFNRDNVDRPDLGNFYTAAPPVTNDDHSKFLSASWRWTPASRLTNELRGGFNIAPGFFDVSGKRPGYFVDPNAGSTLFFDLDSLIFTPPVNTLLPQGRATNTYSLQDNATYTRGRHTIWFGYQSQWIHIAPYDYAGTVPSLGIGLSSNSPYGFGVGAIPGANAADTNTANDLLAALGGLVAEDLQVFNVTSRTSGFVSGAPTLRHFTYNTYSGYVADSWKVRRSLTLTLGLRYDYYTVLNERDSLELLPQLINNNYITTMLSNATLNFAGSSVGRPFYNPDRNNFAPHAGFAWDVFGNGKTAIRGGYSLAYVNDDTVATLVNNIDSTNAGLSGTAANTGLTNTVSSPPSITAPTFQVPRTFADNYNINPGGNAQGMPDPNLRTPYVQLWSLGIQQELKGFIVEARYVANHAVKGLRAIDYNQINYNAAGFLADFKRARSNGFLSQAAGKGFNPAYDPTVPGEQPLTVFPQLPLGGLLDNSFIQSFIASGEVGGLAAIYQQNGLNGNINFFPNPYTNGANVITNYSSSSYNGLQLDLRRRTTSGLQFQFNYSFSKALGNSSGDGVERFEPFLDNAQARIERSRLPFDLTHVFHANFVLPIPMGAGHRFNYAPLGRLLSGWDISSFITYQSGTNFSILSGRATLNRSGLRSALNTVNTTLTKSQLDNDVGFFMTGNGPMFVSPSIIGPDGRGVAADGSAPFSGQAFFNPDPGTLGTLQRRFFNGPWDFNWDFALIKNTKITERFNLEFRADFFNVTNHAAFTPGDEANLSVFNVNDPSFGKIGASISQLAFWQQAPSRLIQFGLYVRF